MLVVKGVIDKAPRPPWPDQTKCTECAELMGNCGLALPNRGREVADAELSTGQGGHDPDSDRVAKGGEQISKPGKCLARRQRRAGRPHRVNMDDRDVAGKVGDIGELVGFEGSGHCLLREMRSISMNNNSYIFIVAPAGRMCNGERS